MKHRIYFCKNHDDHQSHYHFSDKDLEWRKSIGLDVNTDPNYDLITEAIDLKQKTKADNGFTAKVFAGTNGVTYHVLQDGSAREVHDGTGI
jgi:hypothetical protein